MENSIFPQQSRINHKSMNKYEYLAVMFDEGSS